MLWHLYVPTSRYTLHSTRTVEARALATLSNPVVSFRHVRLTSRGHPQFSSLDMSHHSYRAPLQTLPPISPSLQTLWCPLPHLSRTLPCVPPPPTCTRSSLLLSPHDTTTPPVLLRPEGGAHGNGRYNRAHWQVQQEPRNRRSVPHIHRGPARPHAATVGGARLRWRQWRGGATRKGRRRRGFSVQPIQLPRPQIRRARWAP